MFASSYHSRKLSARPSRLFLTFTFSAVSLVVVFIEPLPPFRHLLHNCTAVIWDSSSSSDSPAYSFRLRFSLSPHFLSHPISPLSPCKVLYFGCFFRFIFTSAFRPPCVRSSRRSCRSSFAPYPSTHALVPRLKDDQPSSI